MQGPSSAVRVELGSSADQPELLWITGYRAEVVDTTGTRVLPPEFMCHSNLAFDATRHADLFGWTRRTANRLFTVSQGVSAVTFPEGFGIPVRSDEPLTVTTQVLNHNHPDSTFQVRVRVTIDVVRDEDLREPWVPLFMRSANALVRIDGPDGYYGVPPGRDPPGTAARWTDGTPASHRSIRDSWGRTFAGHWVVPPGRQETHTLATRWMKLPPQARVHFIVAHVHPFADRVTLRDLTDGHDVFTSRMSPLTDRIGLKRVSRYASAEGMVLAADHEYGLTTVYRNTSGQAQEAMAVLYLYLRDDQFHRPVP